MIKKIESTELMVKVTGLKGDDRCITTLSVKNEGYYILEVVKYCQDNGINPHMIFIYTPLDIEPQRYIVQRNGAIEYVEDYD
jgi:hypothetical protein